MKNALFTRSLPYSPPPSPLSQRQRESCADAFTLTVATVHQEQRVFTSIHRWIETYRSESSATTLHNRWNVGRKTIPCTSSVPLSWLSRPFREFDRRTTIHYLNDYLKLTHRWRSSPDTPRAAIPLKGPMRWSSRWQWMLAWWSKRNSRCYLCFQTRNREK